MVAMRTPPANSHQQGTGDSKIKYTGSRWSNVITDSEVASLTKHKQNITPWALNFANRTTDSGGSAASTVRVNDYGHRNQRWCTGHWVLL